MQSLTPAYRAATAGRGTTRAIWNGGGCTRQCIAVIAQPRLRRSTAARPQRDDRPGCPLLGVSRRTVYYRIREGRLRTIRTLGGSQRVLVESVQEQRHGKSVTRVPTRCVRRILNVNHAVDRLEPAPAGGSRVAVVSSPLAVLLGRPGGRGSSGRGAGPGAASRRICRAARQGAQRGEPPRPALTSSSSGNDAFVERIAAQARRHDQEGAEDRRGSHGQRRRAGGAGRRRAKSARCRATATCGRSWRSPPNRRAPRRRGPAKSPSSAR